jgi:hypothetical protein
MILCDRTISERAMTPAQQHFLDRQRVAEGRQSVSDGRIIRRPRAGRKAVIPDLAKTGVMPADHVERGLGGADGGKRGDGKTGGGANNRNSTHDNRSCFENGGPSPQRYLRRSGVRA